MAAVAGRRLERGVRPHSRKQCWLAERSKGRAPVGEERHKNTQQRTEDYGHDLSVLDMPRPHRFG